MLARAIPQEPLTPPTRPTLFIHPTPPPGPPSTLTTRPRVCSLVQAVGLRCGKEGAGTPSPSTTLPPAPPLDARHCAMPAIAESSADLANIVGDMPTTANSRIHSLPGSTAPPPLPHGHRPLHRFCIRPTDPLGARPPVFADPAERQYTIRPPTILDSQLAAPY